MARDGAQPGRGGGPAGAARTGRTARTRGARLLAHVLAVLVVVAGFTAAGPGVQRAEAAPSACSGRPDKVLTFRTGELRVYKNRRYACAVTVAKRPGPRRAMYVSLQPRGGHPVVEEGRFVRRAGPVTVHALNRCVRATGKVSGVGRSTGWILC